MHPPWPVLYEDNHLLVVSKPAMLPTMGVASDRRSLLSEAKEFVRRKYGKPGNVYLGIVSRLDAPVTGIVVLARTSKAAARLTEQFRNRTVEKIYWAAVEGDVSPTSGELVDLVRKDERHRRVAVVPPSTPGAQEARLSYEVRQALVNATLLAVRLDTGRKHQIRLQLSHAGHPIIGDRKYGSRTKFPLGIALHAQRLVISHPVRHEPLELIAPLPASWKKLGIYEYPSGE